MDPFETRALVRLADERFQSFSEAAEAVLGALEEVVPGTLMLGQFDPDERICRVIEVRGDAVNGMRRGSALPLADPGTSNGSGAAAPEEGRLDGEYLRSLSVKTWLATPLEMSDGTIAGVIIGYVTNWVALWMIFEPVEPRRLGRFRLHGLFLRRKPEIAHVYSGIIANDIVNMRNVGEELLHGPRSDRTRLMIEGALRPAVDRAVGPARPAVRVAMGAREYDRIRESVAVEAVDYAMTPLTDPEFNVRQSASVQKLIEARMREMSYQDLVELLRSAMKEDEWLLLLHGAVLGFVAGLIHLGLFG